MRKITKSIEEIVHELILLRVENESLKQVYQKDFEKLNLASKELIESELRYRRLFESAQDGILILDAESGMIVDVNPFLVNLLGFTKEQFVEKEIWEIGFFKDILANKDKFLELQQKEYVRYENLPLETENGKQINVEFVSNVYLENNKKVIQCNIRDITQRKLVEKELLIAKSKSEESDKLKTAFLQNMSHEIRTPLNGIMGFSGLLNRDDISKEEIKEFTTIINQCGLRLIEIINNILDISKIQTGQVSIEQMPVSLNSIFLQLYEFFLPQAKDKNIIMNYNNPNNIDKIIYSDNEKLRQILENLINNAIKFTKYGRIDFGFEITDKAIQIYVKDTGMGIQPEHFDKIFQIFVQVEQSQTRNFDGAGLGLSICTGLVELLGGKIWVESQINEGTTFFFTLPLSPTEDSFQKKIHEIEPTVKRTHGKILIVDDELICFQLLRIFFIKADFTIIHADNGLRAIEFVKSTPDIDLILMDIKMPVMNGIEATKIIKQIRPELPIIAQTAFSLSEEKKEIMAIGCDDYISKPIDFEKLKKILEKYFKF